MEQHNHHKAAIYQWHQLIQEACEYAGIELDPEIQSYLLLTLMRYIHDDQLAENAITMKLNNKEFRSREERLEDLKSTAEHCLILAGLFPSHIDRQFLRISHYIQLGTESYRELSTMVYDNDKMIYKKLSTDFIKLVDVLYTIRIFNGSPKLPLLQAIELWSDTGSKTAYQALTLNRQSIPLSETFLEQAYKH